MDEIVLSKDIAEIIDRCLDVINMDALPDGNVYNPPNGSVETVYGIIIINDDIDRFLLNPYTKVGNFIERLHPDIKINNLDLKEYKEILEDDQYEDDIFDLMYLVTSGVYINGFRISSITGYSIPGSEICNMLSINSKKNNIAGLIELYEFMKKLKEDNRIPQDATIGPVYYMY
jgi:hypothetical protein